MRQMIPFRIHLFTRKVYELVLLVLMPFDNILALVKFGIPGNSGRVPLVFYEFVALTALKRQRDIFYVYNPTLKLMFTMSKTPSKDASKIIIFDEGCNIHVKNDVQRLFPTKCGNPHQK